MATSRFCLCPAPVFGITDDAFRIEYVRRLSRARSLATALALLDDDQYLAPSRALQVVLPTRGLAWQRSRDFDSRSTAGLDLTAPVVAFDISRIRESRPH